jgi:CBS domain-containing protein
MKARDIMITDVPVISMKMPIREAVRILQKNFGDESYMNAAPGLIVCKDNGELAGILSPLSIIKTILDSAHGLAMPPLPGAAFYEELCSKVHDQRVEDVMDWQPISVTEDALLLDVADLFVKNRFQRIPVVRGKQVVGIIYRSRLLFAMARCMLK